MLCFVFFNNIKHFFEHDGLVCLVRLLLKLKPTSEALKLSGSYNYLGWVLNMAAGSKP